MKAILSVLIIVLFQLTSHAQTPKLSSYPSARAVILLDFDGHTVAGTSWNWGGPIVAQASGLSSAAITEIFNRVAEDYRIFNLNITTDSTVYAAAPANKRTRVIVTPTYEWYGMAGGVSYVGSFTWGDETPSWVFSGLLNNNVKYVAEAISHEAGHALGLQHQSKYDINCLKTAEYSNGQGSGEISWSPIMGVGYYTNITTWHNGPNAFGCNSMQSDIDIIAGSPNNFGLRSDDHGNDHRHASVLIPVAQSFQVNGLINTSEDKDAFQIPIGVSTNFRLNAIPQNVGNSNAGANVDIRVCLLNSAGDTLSRYNPSDLLNAGIDTTLTAGIYYLIVEGVGNINLLDYGSVGLYTLAGSLASTLASHSIQLTGRSEKGVHELFWNIPASESGTVLIEYSTDAIRFNTLQTITSSDRSFRWTPPSANSYWYRIHLQSGDSEKHIYSNILSLKQKNPLAFVQSTQVRDHLAITASEDLNWQLISSSGAVLRAGHLLKGLHRLPVQELPAGLMILRIATANGTQTFKIIKQ